MVRPRRERRSGSKAKIAHIAVRCNPYLAISGRTEAIRPGRRRDRVAISAEDSESGRSIQPATRPGPRRRLFRRDTILRAPSSSTDQPTRCPWRVVSTTTQCRSFTRSTEYRSSRDTVELPCAPPEESERSMPSSSRLLSRFTTAAASVPCLRRETFGAAAGAAALSRGRRGSSRAQDSHPLGFAPQRRTSPS